MVRIHQGASIKTWGFSETEPLFLSRDRTLAISRRTPNFTHPDFSRLVNCCLDQGKAAIASISTNHSGLGSSGTMMIELVGKSELG